MIIMRQAKIYRREMLAGMLTEDGGEYTFRYDSAYLASPSSVAISLTKAAYLALIDKRIKALS